MSRFDPIRDEVREALATLDVAKLAAAGIRRDPGGYNLVVHFLPPEVARDHAADDALRVRLSQPTGPIGLYVHVPPCTGRCTFCHYAIEVNPGPERIDRYLAALEREMGLRWSDDRFERVASVLVGGGTPTYLEADQLDRLLGGIRSNVTIPAGTEWTVESAPETLTREKLDVLRQHGVNRLNIGIQSFDDRQLRLLGRRHDAAEARAAVLQARSAGFDNINIDLIYALPGQDLDGWLEGLDVASDLGVQSITTYHLRKRPDTSISRRASPAEDLNLQMHLAAVRFLERRGYRQSLTDYFCLADSETAQMQARDKWRDMQPVDGCGVEACSRRPDVIAFNHGHMDVFSEAVEAGDGWALANGRLLSHAEQLAQRAMFSLKVLDDDGGIVRGRFEAELGESVDSVFGATIAELTELGVIVDDGVRVRLTEIGTLFSDEVCQRFYTPELRRRMLARMQVDATGAVVPNPRRARTPTAARTDVIVVGGGVAGVSVAAELAADLGAGVLLLEAASQLGVGATAASIGGIRAQHSDPLLARLTAAARPLLDDLAAGGLAHIDLRDDGYLFLSTCVADDARLEAQAEHARAVGWPVEMLSAGDVAERWPMLRVDDVRSATFGPSEGHLDPHGLVQAYARRLRAAAGRVETGVRVQSLLIDRGRVVGVRTDGGDLRADTVVLAAGADVADLIVAAGVRLPMRSGRRRIFLATGAPAMPSSGPLVLSYTPALYFRAEASGVIASAWEFDEEQGSDPVEQEAAVREAAHERLLHRLPGLAGARFRPAFSGIQTHAADGRPYVGPCPGLDGLVLVAALAGHGVMHAPIVARLAADWVRREAPGELAAALDPRRVRV